MRHNAAGRRPRNRSHGGHGRNNNRGSGGHHNNSRVQVYDSNGPDVRIRGTAYQIHEKYLALAKDAAAAGDSVLSEGYLQHAEHYQRIISGWIDFADGRSDYYLYSSQQSQSFSQPESDGLDAAVSVSPAAVSTEMPREDSDLGLPASIIGTRPVQSQANQQLEDA